jgi:uncharacterized RDD family membrane protein YckC
MRDEGKRSASQPALANAALISRLAFCELIGEPEPVTIPKLDLWIWAVLALLLFAVYVGYFVCFEAFWQGQTPGKRIAKIRVIRDDGRPVSLPQTTLRALLRPIDDAIFTLGAFLIMFRQREKRLGDDVAGTLVVQEETSVRPQRFSLSEQARSWLPQLAEMADVSPLSPDDFAVVRDYLQCRSLFTKTARARISITLAQQIKTIVAMEQTPPNLSADLFLEAIYLAYQQPENGPSSALG